MSTQEHSTRKTVGLIGLLFLGIALLTNSSSGILAAGPGESAAAVVTPITTGEPPFDDGTATTAQPSSPADPEPAADPIDETTPTTPPSSTTSTTIGAVSVLGSVETSRFGPFQVEVVVEDGVIVDVALVQEPGDRRSQRINDRAEPLYEQAVLAAQSADIDVVSGATVTWEGYTTSLQAALDQIGMA